MRLNLAGHDGPKPPIIIAATTGSLSLVPYLAQGYTNYEVLCVGASGGRGGALYTNITSGGAVAWNFVGGGGGGGGGVQFKSGLLAALPTLVPIVVGAAGADRNNTAGVPGASPGTQGLPGLDGGFSTFNGTLCRASGGKGGQGARILTAGIGDGGQGGKGGQTTAGGGAAGAPGGVYDPRPFDPDPGSDGTWDGSIGTGGGGGGGGYGTWSRTAGVDTYMPEFEGSKGGRGAYNVSQTAFAAASPPVQNYVDLTHSYTFPNLLAGCGGGAKVTPLTFRPNETFGNKLANNIGNGAVIIRLTKP